MIIIISPSKRLDFKTSPQTSQYSNILFPNKVSELVKVLSQMELPELGRALKIKPDLARKTLHEYKAWDSIEMKENRKQALFAFSGDVFKSMQAKTFGETDIKFARKHLRILSGLYGILRPLDMIQSYRLDIGNKFSIHQVKDLYQYWREDITKTINNELNNSESRVMINLASDEYFKVLETKRLNARIIKIEFKENKGDQYKTVGIYAKKARGLMCNYMIRNMITNPSEIISFNSEGYYYNEGISDAMNYIFTRG